MKAAKRSLWICGVFGMIAWVFAMLYSTRFARGIDGAVILGWSVFVAGLLYMHYLVLLFYSRSIQAIAFFGKWLESSSPTKQGFSLWFFNFAFGARFGRPSYWRLFSRTVFLKQLTFWRLWWESRRDKLVWDDDVVAWIDQSDRRPVC